MAPHPPQRRTSTFVAAHTRVVRGAPSPPPVSPPPPVSRAVARLVAHLQPARPVFLTHDRQAAIVGMGTGAHLAGQRLVFLIGIVQHPEHADMTVDLVVEEGFRQLQRQLL